MSWWVIWVDYCFHTFKLIDGGVHCSCWMDTEECIRRSREQYRLRKDRETPEETERRCRNQKCLWRQRAAIPVEQRGLVRIRNVQVSTSIWGLVCIIMAFIDLNLVCIMTSIVGVSLRLFLMFEQQQRGSAHRHTLAHRWMGVERHVGGWWPRMTMNIALCNDKLVTLTTPVNRH